MDRLEALRWLRVGIRLLLKFPERRGWVYVGKENGICKVCLAGAAAIVSFEGKPFKMHEAVTRAMMIDQALDDMPTQMNGTGYGGMTQELADKVFAWIDKQEAEHA